jgi:hypothetical protein
MLSTMQRSGFLAVRKRSSLIRWFFAPYKGVLGVRTIELRWAKMQPRFLLELQTSHLGVKAPRD